MSANQHIHFTIDQGNTSTKIAFFAGKDMLHHAVMEDETLLNDLQVLFEKFQASTGICSSVRANADELVNCVKQYADVLLMHAGISLPFTTTYETPATLGNDRKANAAAAIAEFGKVDMVIVDCGTCITYTVLKQGSLVGGAIAPGVKMRLAALHHYTGRLPKIAHLPALPELLGRSTEASIRAGTEHAAVLETLRMTEKYCSELRQPRVILTGGLSSFFEPHFKTPIFARPFLTLQGLHEILQYQNNTN